MTLHTPSMASSMEGLDFDRQPNFQVISNEDFRVSKSTRLPIG